MEGGNDMDRSVPVKKIGHFGIFEDILGFFNVFDLRNDRIADTFQFCSVEDAEEYISHGVSYGMTWSDLFAS